MASAATLVAVAAEFSTLVLDGRQEGRAFEGLGALSAGASSRLLIEYAEPYRSQILDYLFRPNYGAGFQHLKVEIGGDVNSTDGCEPSHMHWRKDQNYRRGYEWWLMKEARRRNPRIFLDCLEWGAPAWIGHGYFHSADNADYIAKFIKGAKAVHGLDVQYAGIWNETRADLGWIKLLRQTLDRKGLANVQIVAADDINRWNLVEVMKKDTELARAVQIVGVHYPKYHSTPAARDCGKPIWASEDGPWKGNWAGASALVKLYNRNYIEGRMTKTIIWSPVTSYYDNLPLPGSGVMRANAPWAGSYEVPPAVWATAHTTQFAQPGWRYLEGAGCGLLSTNGSYVTLKSNATTDYSIILETIDANEPQPVAFEIAGGLSTGPIHVWRSSAAEQFVRLKDLEAIDGKFTFRCDPGCIFSLTTTTGQTKGGAVGAPPAPFPAPYLEDFESYPPGLTPRFFSDQAGIFEVARRATGKGRCLRQIVDQKGIEWPFHLNPAPETFIGDPNWTDYTVSVDALLEQPGYLSLFGRVGAIPQNANLPGGYWLKVDERGNWELGTATAAMASGRVPFSLRTWHRLKLQFVGDTLQAFIDQATVAELKDNTYLSGMAGLGCGWHRAQFDNFSILLDPAERNLAFAQAATASSSADVDSGAANATDGNAFSTRWTAVSGRTNGEWLAVNLGKATRFNTVILKPFEDRITAFKIQHRQGEEWLDAYASTNLGSAPKRLEFPAVVAQQVRLLVAEAKSNPSIWELEVRHRLENPHR